MTYLKLTKRDYGCSNQIVMIYNFLGTLFLLSNIDDR